MILPSKEEILGMVNKMRKLNFVGFALFLISLGIIFLGMFSITGHVISDKKYFSLTNIIGFALLFLSFILMTSRKSLEAIVIPAGKKEENKTRAKRGRDYYNNDEQYFIISGGRGDEPLRESDMAEIYNELREAEKLRIYGKKPKIKPSQIVVEGRSADTLENVLYSLQKLKSNTGEITFVSYPLHLRKMRMIMKKAREEGLVPGGLKERYVPTSQNISEFIYGVLALAKEKYRLRNGIKEAQKNKTGEFGNFVKRLLEG